jgi:hypothetical protein
MYQVLQASIPHGIHLEQNNMTLLYTAISYQYNLIQIRCLLDFFAKIVEVCQLDTDTPTVVKVDLNIITDIRPSKNICFILDQFYNTNY